MLIEKINEKLKKTIKNLDKENFIYSFLDSYGLPKTTISRLKKGDYNSSKNSNEVLWKKNFLYSHHSDQNNLDLYKTIVDIEKNELTNNNKIRFIIVTDFNKFLAIDLKTKDNLNILLKDLPKYSDFFLPMIGREKAENNKENPADIKAAEKIAEIYDLVVDNNKEFTKIKSNQHYLNIFFSRLLFCFFSEDAEIFLKNIFTESIQKYTEDDGSDLKSFFEKLFLSLNTKNRNKELSIFKKFPYVNGGLFEKKIILPSFTQKIRNKIVKSGSIDWKSVNPDILGSLMQAVVHKGERRDVGMHYTSVKNILNLIKPLFLDELYEQYYSAEYDEKKLEKILRRIYNIKIFDPACGSGNFLVIAFKEMCRLEIEIYKRLQEIDKVKWSIATSGIRLSKFHGIEIDDYAHEISKLSLWLAEHQMNLYFKDVFGESRPSLPLSDTGTIICENSANIDWNDFCTRDSKTEIFIIGNPPYIGSRKQNKDQKEDIKNTLGHLTGYKRLDYISIWFFKASKYIVSKKEKCAFVSTNSVCQGEHVNLLWPELVKNIEINFAYKSIKWSNSARGNAGVIVVILGLAVISNEKKFIFENKNMNIVRHINPYLLPFKDVFINNKSNSISNLPLMEYGNMALEGNFLKLSENEYSKITKDYPESLSFIRKLTGGDEFLNNKLRWCLWIKDKDLDKALSIKPIKERIKKVEEFRLNGGDVAKTLSKRSHQFRYMNEAKQTLLLLPQTFSNKKEYIPVGFFSREYITLHSAQVIYDPPLFIFSILSSKIHRLWMSIVGGRLGDGYRYSTAICYNTFPFPQISDDQKKILEEHVLKILDQRSRFTEKTISELYDPKKMPEGLLKAHLDNDSAVEECYKNNNMISDQQKIMHLFDLFESLNQKDILI
jgi:hypothetical protein